MKLASTRIGQAKIVVDELLSIVELSDEAERRFGDLSAGMKQRLAVARALLSDAQLITFQDEVMTGVAEAIDSYRSRILSGRTWGDGIYLVFDDIGTAASCALTILDRVGEMDFEGMGLHTLRSMRIAAHATPVFDGVDPIDNSRVFFGAGVTQTARIEPRTPEGEIYTTHPFASLAVLCGDTSLDTQYVGTLPTAKGWARSLESRLATNAKAPNPVAIGTIGAST